MIKNKIVLLLVLISGVLLKEDVSEKNEIKELKILENEEIKSVTNSIKSKSASPIWPPWWLYNKYSKSKIAKEKKIPDVDPNTIIPGFTGWKGYVSSTGKFVRNECFKPSKIVTGRSIMTANSLSKSSSKSLMKEITAGLSLSVGVVDMVKVGLNFDFSKAFEESNYSLDFYFYMKYTRDREIQYGILPEEILQPDALRLYQSSKSEFMKKCGNQVVSKVREAAFVIIHAKFEFASVAEKTGFGVGLNLKLFDLVEFSSKFHTYLKTGGRKGNIKFTGKQVGGDIHEFSKYFPDNTSDSCAGVVDTSLDFKEHNKAFKECEQFITDVYKYMNEDFQLQMKEEDESFDDNLDTLIKYHPLDAKVSKIPSLDLTGY